MTTSSSMEDAEAMDLTRRLVARVRAISYDAMPPDVRTVARQCLLDWVGVTLAGYDQPLTRILRDDALEQGGRGLATLVGAGGRVTIQQAALVNGAASHALDYDDVALMMSGHPTVPVAPALLALGEREGSSGEDLLAAFVAGVEMECRVGAAVMPGHYDRGWHATGTLGTFGAAAACAHLLKLDEGQWLHAMGIAGTQAAGLKSMFGTMCKPFHAGKAAANGLAAATLAARGFVSHPAVLETHQGFAHTQTATYNPETAVEAHADAFAVSDVLFKYHAACYGTHELIEGVLRLRAEHNLQPGDVERIELVVPPGNMSMCNIAEPRTALEGKFSMRFTAALALTEGEASEGIFRDEVVGRGDLADLRDRVSVTPYGPGARRGTTVSLTLRDGATVEDTVDLTIPERDLVRQWDRLGTKFVGLAAPVIGTDAAEDLLGAIRGDGRFPGARELMERTAATARRVAT